jgi:hypothetical protein
VQIDESETEFEVLFSLEALEAVENENLPLVTGLKTEVLDNAEVEEAKNLMKVDVNDPEMVGEGGGRLEKRKRFVHPVEVVIFVA